MRERVCVRVWVQVYGCVIYCRETKIEGTKYTISLRIPGAHTPEKKSPSVSGLKFTNLGTTWVQPFPPLECRVMFIVFRSKSL